MYTLLSLIKQYLTAKKALTVKKIITKKRAVQLLLGYKLESTVRYLGIEVDDTLEMADKMEV